MKTSWILFSYSRIVHNIQFDDLEVVRGDDGQPLLWTCARRGIVTEKIAMDERLRGQVAKVYSGTLPLELGERMNDGFISGLWHTKKFNLILHPTARPRDLCFKCYLRKFLCKFPSCVAAKQLY